MELPQVIQTQSPSSQGWEAGPNYATVTERSIQGGKSTRRDYPKQVVHARFSPGYQRILYRQHTPGISPLSRKSPHEPADRNSHLHPSWFRTRSLKRFRTRCQSQCLRLADGMKHVTEVVSSVQNCTSKERGSSEVSSSQVSMEQQSPVRISWDLFDFNCNGGSFQDVLW